MNWIKNLLNSNWTYVNAKIAFFCYLKSKKGYNKTYLFVKIKNLSISVTLVNLCALIHQSIRCVWIKTFRSYLKIISWHFYLWTYVLGIYFALNKWAIFIPKQRFWWLISAKNSMIYFFIELEKTFNLKKCTLRFLNFPIDH